MMLQQPVSSLKEAVVTVSAVSGGVVELADPLTRASALDAHVVIFLCMQEAVSLLF